MKALIISCFLCLASVGLLSLAAQDANVTSPIPAPPAPEASGGPKITPAFLFAGPEALGSNLGVQEIVEVLRSPQTATPAPKGGDPSDPSSAPGKLQVSTNAGMRTYHTSNVMRVQTGAQGAGVLEFSAGANLAAEPIPVLDRVVQPSFTVMLQRAYYGQFSIGDGDVQKSVVKDILDYEFRMLNLGAAFPVTEDWQANASIAYDELRSFRTGEKKYHAFSPIFSISRMKPLTETSMVSLDANARYAFTKTISPYEIPGVFEDDGDNWQAGVNLTYARIFGPEGRLVVLPSMGITRTAYPKNQNSGRVDYLWTAGVSAMYSLTEHFGIQAFMTYGNKSANAKGRSVLGSSQKYENLDLGIAITGQYAF